MAEITKVTTPLIPKENLGNRNKPVSDQAFELNDPSKVQRSTDQGKILDHQRDGQAALRDGVGKEVLAPALKDVNDLIQNIQKITMLLQMGISASDVVNSQEVKELLREMFLAPDELAQAILEQDNASVLFKGNAFDLLRDLLSKFADNPRIEQAVYDLLKAFDHNVNAENSIRTILITCQNLLDYMFSGDRQQFSQYLDGLTDLLLPETLPEALTADRSLGEEIPEESQLQGQATRSLGVEEREAAQILKGNLLPLLGEIVVKYNQNERIRDMVMVVVHNIVRVDQGTPETLLEAVEKLVAELRQLATLPENFEQQLTTALANAKEQAVSAQNDVIAKLTDIIARTLSDPSANPVSLRQAENLLFSLLQNQSSVMDILHFVLPMQTEHGQLFAELYVDPDSEESVGRASKDRSRKLFIAFESDDLGTFEMSFLETGERVDFSMWCPERYVKSLGSLKRHISDLMQLHGYSMNSYLVEELTVHKTIAEVFPRLLNRRIGIDVRT